MNKRQIVLKVLEKKRINLLKAIKNAKSARDNAPSATESHSDTTRSQNERLIFALEAQFNEIEKVLKNISSLPLFILKINSKICKFILVPEGVGGEEIGGIRLLSEKSPLGLELKNKKIGEKFEFNKQVVEIEEIEC
jgi:hypothetical protein